MQTKKISTILTKEVLSNNSQNTLQKLDKPDIYQSKIKYVIIIGSLNSETQVWFELELWNILDS